MQISSNISPQGSYTVVAIDHTSPLFGDVQRMWRIYSDTLGPFPRGAFEDHAIKKQILAATDTHNNLVGYLLYRVAMQRNAVIVHMCVDKAMRGQGIARLLFHHLCNTVSYLDDIRATCRRDFEANLIWPRLGFAPVHEKAGRGKDRKPLTVWRFDLSKPPLLAAMFDAQSRYKVCAVIDANVFYDLQDDNNEETNGLLADYLGELLNLHVTAEIHHEIDRQPNPAERIRRRQFVSQFEILSASTEEVTRVFDELKNIYQKKSLRESDRSDLRQLAHAVASKATLFITRDERLLEQNDNIRNTYGLNMLRPCDAIIHLDELLREEAYKPERLSGSPIQIARIQPGELEKVVSLIREPTDSARQEVETRLRLAMARPTKNKVFVIREVSGGELAVICLNYDQSGRLDIPIFRVFANGPLANTIARHLVERVVNTCARESLALVSVSVQSMQDELTEALHDASFSRLSNQWVKLCIPRVASCTELGHSVRTIGKMYDDISSNVEHIASLLEQTDSSLERHNAFVLEKALWPAKILEADIPNFIIPIKAKWAMELFDESLARQCLFGARPELILRAENVYYRSSRPRVLSAPARVLWYVSQEGEFQGTMSVRACSYIDEVVVGRPKDLYRQFRRLGVYRWEDVFALTEQRLEGELMAFRFSRSELFHRPVSWKQMQEILVSTQGRSSQIQSPTAISSEVFFKIYNLGVREASANG